MNRVLHATVLLGLVLLAGCATPEPSQKTAKAETTSAKPLPDLVVDQADLSSGWLKMAQADSVFAGDSCTAIEGGFGGYTGNRTFKLLGFNVLTVNIGDAPLHLGNVADLAAPGYDKTQALDPVMALKALAGYVEFAPCAKHNHWHYRNYSKYELIGLNADGTYGNTLRGRKQGYCMYDTVGTYAAKDANGLPIGKLYPQSTLCSFQGLSPGWGDNYWPGLDGQYFILNDPNDPSNPNAPGQLAAGNYILRITVNPPFYPAAGEICPVRDGAGMCRMFAEKNYNNNMSQTVVPLSAADVAPWPTTGQALENLKPVELSVNKGMQRW